MDISLAIIDYVDDVFLPNTLYYNSPMQSLLQGTGDVACWHNDIYSFQKVFKKFLLILQSKKLLFNLGSLFIIS
ncbi:hypothetical protein CY35_18G012400 [Sphagnum magellanicum]|nr:hypothetical protein CY35_18G012400 [Sphagnum magellanicum]